MDSVAVYQLKDRLLVHPWNKTTMGLGMATEPYLALPLEAGSKAVGEAVLAAMAQSGRTVGHPTAWKGLSAPLLKAAGVKSERAFQAGSRYVSVDRRDGGYVIGPTRNGGTSGDEKGHHPLPALTFTIAAGSAADQLGDAVRDGLKRCTQEVGRAG